MRCEGKILMSSISRKKISSFSLAFLFLGVSVLGLIISDYNEISKELPELQTPKNVYVSTCGPGTYTDVLHSSECYPASAGYYVPDSRDHDSKKIASGGYHTCVILDNGSLSCWGDNRHGQLGDGTNTNRTTPTPITSLGVDRFPVTIAAGNFHTCVALDDGSVSCWGRNMYGQLGDGSNTDNSTPTQVSGFGPDMPVVALSAGPRHTCAILDDGSVSCWGHNNVGQLGDGTTDNQNTPTQPLSLGDGRTAISVATGGYHTCAILDDGSVSCWGRNVYGQLGDQTNIDRSSPTQTSTLGEGRVAIAISAGQGHSCATLDDGTVSCWGRNNHGQLGDGTDIETNVPIQTSSLGSGKNAVSVSIGRFHTCAALDDGSVSCWGFNGQGQLGDGTNTSSNVPIEVLNTGAILQVSMNYLSSCAILIDGSVTCWGTNIHGQLGDGTYTNHTTPNPTSGFGADRTVALNSTYLPGGGGLSQTACEEGTYQSATGQTSCNVADAGHYVSFIAGTAQTLQSPCMEGTYNINTGSINSSDCMDADVGFYVPTTGQSSQIECMSGTYQPATGQSACIYADTGHYVESTGQSSQTECEVGTYQSLTGQTFCDVADPGYYVDSTGQSSQTACLAGSYNANAGSISSTDCLDASVGHYVALSAQITQTECPAGTYQPATGQSSCIDASVGHYVALSAQTTQTECPVGTYQPTTGQSSCIDADIGHYVASTGQSIQKECLAGTYQENTGQSYCENSDIGHYVPTNGQSAQTPCSAGTYQSASGQISCIEADEGHYVDGDAATSQTACEEGSHSSGTGSSDSSDCIDEKEDKFKIIMILPILLILILIILAIIFFIMGVKEEDDEEE